MADLSWFIAAMGGVVGGVAGEVRTQNRVSRRLDKGLARRWDEMGGLERYSVGRELRRGRTLDDDPELGAAAAAALRQEIDRRWVLWLFGGLGVVFGLLAVVSLAMGHFALAGVEALFVLAFGSIALWQPRALRKLAVAAEANRALYEG